MEDKICLVTGATAGIGEVTARELARLGATVVVVSRNAQKCEATVAEIRQTTGNERVSWLAGDLSSQADCHAVAAGFKARHAELHVLVNNAGAYFRQRRESVDGIEMTFALNHLGYFLLTNLLLAELKAGAPSRIINVSSAAHRSGTLDLADVDSSRGQYRGLAVYGQSKMANILFTEELARRLGGTGVTANSLHPGLVATNFAVDNGRLGRLARPFLNLFSISAEKGAETTLFLATSREVAGLTGRYLDKKKAVTPSPPAGDPEFARRLWRLSEDLTGLTPAPTD